MLNFNTICSNKPNLNDAAIDIFKQLSKIDKLVKITVFVAGNTDKELHSCKQIIDTIWQQVGSQRKIRINLVAQKPLNCSLSAEYVSYEGNGILHYKQEEGVDVVEIDEAGNRVILLNGINDKNAETLEEQAETIFQKSSEILKQNNFSYKHIVRQWNYIPSILAASDEKQNYQVFNDIRSNTYNLVNWTSGYPAATGIGVAGTRLSIDLIAVDGFGLRTITNPDQIDAHIYSNKVLENGCLSTRTTPKFERAKLLETATESLLFVSGTAAIEGEDSHEAEVSRQTELTLQHIHSLCQLAVPEGEKELKTSDVRLLRAYIKHTDDYERVERICRDKYPEAPIICVKADVCRDELLVEIEAFVKTH